MISKSQSIVPAGSCWTIPDQSEPELGTDTEDYEGDERQALADVEGTCWSSYV